MKLIIAGSRDITDYDILLEALDRSGYGRRITEVISGGARGVDSLGERFADEYGIQNTQYLPLWEKYGKSAGYKRNILMAENADALLAIWDGKSKGTKHMIDIATGMGLKVYYENLDNDTSVYIRPRS